MPLGEEGKVSAASKAREDGFVAHRLPVGPGGSPEVLEIWQEGAHVPRGITKKTYFWARKTYHHQIKERMPGWLNQSMLGSWKWIRKQFKKPTPPAWLNPAPMDNPGCVILLRWDPLKDHWAGVRVLAACAQGLQSSQDTALVVRMPDGDGRWQERLNALAKVAERLPAWDGALVAQSESQIVEPGDCLPRLDWAITWETDLTSALWAGSLKKRALESSAPMSPACMMGMAHSRATRWPPPWSPALSRGRRTRFWNPGAPTQGLNPFAGRLPMQPNKPIQV